MKYDKDHIDKIVEALQNGDGRVRACKIAGITYQTFINWMESEIEFLERIKKAESIGEDKIEDLQRRKVIENPAWQSGAWFLERRFPEKYGIKQQFTINKPIQIITETETAKEIDKFADKHDIHKESESHK